MSKIAVIGMGQGGMVAAIKLAKAGYDVTIFEKKSEEDVSYPWRDDIRYDIFDTVDLPKPEESVCIQKPKWVFVSPNEHNLLRVPQLKPMEEVSISRKGLTKHFVQLATENGAKCQFDSKVKSLIIEDEIVKGIVVNDEKQYFDLVIDACGLNSKFRAEIPKKFGIQAQPTKKDTMFGYRAFYKHIEGTNTIDDGIPCTLIAKHLGGEGISWCNLNEDDQVDVLIGRVNYLSDDDIQEMLADLKANNPILSDELIYKQTVPICLRCGIARAVADGYCVVGDSAFMTIPVMGSGIEASMQGGNFLAKHIIDNKITDFSAKNLYGYYVEYMDKLGKGFVLLDVLRRWALKLPAEWIDWVMSGKLIKYNELAYVMLEKGYGKPKFNFWAFFKIPFVLLSKPKILCSILGMARKGLKGVKIAGKMPREYNEKKLNKWQAKYDAIIDKMEETK